MTDIPFPLSCTNQVGYYGPGSTNGKICICNDSPKQEWKTRDIQYLWCTALKPPE